MSDASEQPGLAEQAPESIRWQSWPARDGAVRTLLVVIGLLAIGLLVYWLTQRTYLAVLAVFVLVISLWRFFVPVQFELSREGIDQKFFGRRRRIRWEAIRHYEVCSAGVLLLPDEDHTPLAPFRGLYVPWSTHHEEVLAQVRHYLGPQEGS